MTDSTNNAPERIWLTNFVKEGYGARLGRGTISDLDHGPNPDYPEYIRADLAPDPLRAVKVKSLAWTIQNERCVEAHIGGFATYAIYIRDDGQFSLRMSWSLLMTDGVYDTLEAAKAAAQADYEQRIRSALDPDPQDARVKALVEAWSGVGSHPGISLSIRGDDAQHTWDNFRAALAAFDKGGKTDG